jgi:hypothetical protein
MKFSKVILLSVFFCACTEVQVRTPNPRIEPPELRGDQGVKIGTEVWGAHVYKATDDGSARPPDLSRPGTYGDLDLSGSFSYSPASPFEFGVEAHPLGGLSGVVRFQLAGHGTRASEPGDFPIAAYVRAGTAIGERSGDQKGLFGPGGYNWKGRMNANYVHAGLSLGQRVLPHMLVYGGGAIGQYWNRTEVDQDANTGAGDPGGTYKANDSGNAQTGGLGMLFNWTHVQFFVGADFTHISYHSTRAENDLFVSGGLTITPR